jgi:HEAT repeat protein
MAAAVLDPNRRFRGWTNDEPFYQGRAASAWARDLREPDSPESAEALQSLIAGKSDAAPTCGWVLRNAAEPETRSRAGDALAKMGKDAAIAKDDIVAALSDSDSLVRAVAIRAVGELAPELPGAIPPLIKLFPDVESIQAVAKFGPAGGDAVPALTALLTHENSTVRWQATRTLGKIREPSLPALPELMRLTLDDPDPLVREHAAEAMGDIGPAAAAGVPTLIKALKDPVARVRRDAVRSLGQIGPAAKAAIEDVRKAAEDSDSNVRTAATRAIRLIDPTAAQKK